MPAVPSSRKQGSPESSRTKEPAHSPCATTGAPKPRPKTAMAEAERPRAQPVAGLPDVKQASVVRVQSARTRLRLQFQPPAASHQRRLHQAWVRRSPGLPPRVRWLHERSHLLRSHRQRTGAPCRLQRDTALETAWRLRCRPSSAEVLAAVLPHVRHAPACSDTARGSPRHSVAHAGSQRAAAAQRPAQQAVPASATWRSEDHNGQALRGHSRRGASA